MVKFKKLWLFERSEFQRFFNFIIAQSIAEIIYVTVYTFSGTGKDRAGGLITEFFDTGWHNLQVADNFFVKDWVLSQKHDYKTRLKTIIDKTESPQIPVAEIEEEYNEQLFEFYLKHNNKIKTPSLGVASLLNQVSISFRSNNYWNKSEIYLLKNKPNIEFQNCIFCNSTEKQFKQLHINDATYNKLWYILKKLNNSIPKCSNNDELKEKTLNLKWTNLRLSMAVMWKTGSSSNCIRR